MCTGYLHTVMQVKFVRGNECRQWINLNDMVMIKDGDYSSIDDIGVLTGHFITGLWFW